MEKIIGLIPARAGSERIKNKNFKNFHGMPLILYAIFTAIQSGIFDDIAISTDDTERLNKILNKLSGDEIKNKLIIHKRPSALSGPHSNDCEWITDIFETLGWRKYEYYMILRPTNPFRTFCTIQRAWNEYQNFTNFTNRGLSMKSVHIVSERPEKMWVPQYEKNVADTSKLDPLMFLGKMDGIPLYEKQTYGFPLIFIQNGCIDISPVSIIYKDRKRYIGDEIIPFFTNNEESMDLNTNFDWLLAEAFIRTIISQNHSFNSAASLLNFVHLRRTDKTNLH